MNMVIKKNSICNNFSIKSSIEIQKSRFQNWKRLHFAGDPGQSRTGDLPLRRRLLYPTELRNHKRTVSASFKPAHRTALTLYTKNNRPARIDLDTIIAINSRRSNNYSVSAKPGGILHSTRTPVLPHKRVKQTLKASKLDKGSKVVVTKSRTVAP